MNSRHTCIFTSGYFHKLLSVEIYRTKAFNLRSFISYNAPSIGIFSVKEKCQSRKHYKKQAVKHRLKSNIKIDNVRKQYALVIPIYVKYRDSKFKET